MVKICIMWPLFHSLLKTCTMWSGAAGNWPRCPKRHMYHVTPWCGCKCNWQWVRDQTWGPIVHILSINPGVTLYIFLACTYIYMYIYSKQTHFQQFRRSFFKMKTRRRPRRPAWCACFQKTHFSEKASETNFWERVFHNLTNMNDTQWMEFYVYIITWVFRVHLPLYFNSNGLV